MKAGGGKVSLKDGPVGGEPTKGGEKKREAFGGAEVGMAV